jgi:hypothetical protein
MIQKDYITPPSFRAFSPNGVNDEPRLVGGFLFDMKALDLTGMKFGRWEVLSLESRSPSRWNVRCECGTEKVVEQYSLRIGESKSCGCLTVELMTAKQTKHGMYGSPTYIAWAGIIARCTNPKEPSYKNYGGRGISVCDRWRKSFENFYADMGEKPTPKHSIDRINVNWDYDPFNCRWATAKEQARNKRNTIFYTDGIIMMSIYEWAELLSVSASSIKSAIKRENNKYNLKRVTK